MGSLFPSSFELSPDCFTYLGWAEVPNVRFIEIVFDKGTAQSRIEEGLLHEKNIEAWLDKDFGHEDDSTRAGGLRLMYPYPCRRVIKAYRICNLTDTPFRLLEEDHDYGQISIPKGVLRSILKHFSLPSPYLSTNINNAARSAMFESKSDSDHRLLSFLTRDDLFKNSSHALALTHNLQTSVTSSIMIGHPDFLEVFVPYLKERPDLVRNPSFLVLVVAQVDFNLAESYYRSVRSRSSDVESKTGHGANFFYKNLGDLGDLKQLDLPEMTKSVHWLASHVATAEQKVKICLLRHKRLAEFDKRIQEAHSPEKSLEWDRNAQEMRQHIEWMVDSLRSMLHEYEICAKGAASQMSIIYSYTSQRENELNIEVAKDSKSIAAASKRDSSAMKSIALLTMLFLPATFVSTLFAMPILDWNADRGSTVVTRRAWIYLAVTLPLTVLVLCVWFGWLFVSERMHRKTDENARASLFPRREEDKGSTDEVSEAATDLENGEVFEDTSDAEHGRRSKITWLSGLLRRRTGRNAQAVRFRSTEGLEEGTDEEQ